MSMLGLGLAFCSKHTEKYAIVFHKTFSSQNFSIAAYVFKYIHY